MLAGCGGAWLLLGDTDPAALSTAMGREQTGDDATPDPSTTVNAPSGPGVATQRLVTDVTPRAGAIQGKVTRPDGTHVHGAEVRVRLSTPSGQRSYALVSTFDQTVSTDEEGQFQLDVPGGGVYRVTARAEEFAPGIQSGVRPGDVVTIALAEPAGLKGVVLEQETGRALPGVRVTAHLPAPHDQRETETDEAGMFAFAALPTGLVRLDVVAKEHVSPDKVEEEVKPGEVSEVTVRLAAGKVIEGKVVASGDERPVANAVVTAAKREVTTDARGRFEIRGLPTAQLRVDVRGPGYLPQGRNVNLAGSRRRAKVAFQLAHGATIFGRVTAITGDPVVGVRVRLFVTWDERNRGHNSWEHHGTRKLDIRTDEYGRYEIAGIEPQGWSWYVVRVHAPGMPIGWSNPVKIRRPDDRLSADVRFGLGAEIVGRVIDQDRNPIGGARVAVTPQGVWGPQAQNQTIVGGTGTDGQFRISGVSDGRYTVSIDARGYARGWKGGVKVERNRGPGDLEFQLVMGEPLHGTVTDTTGSPLEGVRVDAWSRGGHGMALSDAEGRFQMASVPKGPWRVSAHLEGYARWNQNKVEAAGDEGVKIEMSPQAVLVGQVLDAVSGEPIKSFRVALSADDPKRGRRRQVYANGVSDREGRFKIQRADGTYKLHVTARGYVGHEIDQIVFDAASPPAPVDVVLRKGGGIEGYVKDELGRPISSVQVYRRRGLPHHEDYAQAVRTEHDGYFFIGDLDAGAHDLVFHGGGRPLETWRDIRVGGDQPAWVEATLTRVTTLRVTAKFPKGKNNRQPQMSWNRWGGFRSSRGVSVEVTALDQSDVLMQSTSRDPVRGRLYKPVSRRTFRVRSKLTTTELPIGRYKLVAKLKGHPDQVEYVSLGFGRDASCLFDFTPPQKPKAEAGTPAGSQNNR